MNLNQIIAPLQRWWWLLIASTVLAGISSLVVVLTQQPVYLSRTTLMIGRVLEDPNPSSGQFYLAQQLAETYADIGNREPLRFATMRAVGTDWLPEYRVRALPNSQLIEIAVTDTDPTRSQVFARELANQLIAFSPSETGINTQDRQTFIKNQLDLLQKQISDTQAQIETLQIKLGSLSSAQQIADTQGQIDSLTNKLNTTQLNYATMLANSKEGAFNSLTIIEPANLPNRPVGPDKVIPVALSAVLGLVMAAGAAYLLEFLDQTVKSVDEIANLVPEFKLGSISAISKNSNGGTIVTDQPRSRIADEFRTLRNNLEFLGIDMPLRTIYVASSIVGEGKSTVSVNLALVFAQAEKKVLLIDADLRRPKVHKMLGIPNRVGLSDLILNRVDLLNALVCLDKHKIHVLTTGPLPPNPTEVLGSNKMSTILDEVKQDFDMIIVDGPPFLVADAAILAHKTDGILWVMRPGVTRRDAIQMMKEQITRAHARLLGIVVNGVNVNYAAYSGYYSGYTSET